MPFVLLDETEYHYRISKRGLEHETALICLHGSGADGIVWGYQLSRLSRYYKVIILDLPGHGQSGGVPLENAAAYARWLNELFDALDVEQAFVAGHSFGGAIAQEFARSFPQRVQGLVLVGTGMSFGLSRTYRDLHQEGAITLENADALPEPYRSGFEALKNVSGPGLHADLMAAGCFDSAGWINSVSVPALVVWGKDDMITPRALPQQLAGRLPRADFVEIERAGHVVMVDARDDFNTAVKSFIEAVLSDDG